jgi:hypothetical protein
METLNYCKVESKMMLFAVGGVNVAVSEIPVVVESVKRPVT